MENLDRNTSWDPEQDKDESDVEFGKDIERSEDLAPSRKSGSSDMEGDSGRSSRLEGDLDSESGSGSDVKRGLSGGSLEH